MHWSVPCCSSDSIVSPLYSQMKEALAHKKWSSRAVHRTCDTNLPTSWFCPEGALSSQESTNSNMGVASLPHSSATEDGRKIELTSLDALTLHQWYEWLQLGCRDWLWGLVGFYNNYQKLIFIQSPLTMMCYILKVLPGIIYSWPLEYEGLSCHVLSHKILFLHYLIASNFNRPLKFYLKYST